jgi:hypothetical protein
MAAFLEVWGDRGVRVVALDGARLTVGRAESNDIALPSDDTVSRMHAVLERYPTGWAVRDLGSSNGTFVNGRPVVGEQRFADGDEIRIGQVRLILRGDEAAADDLKSTAVAELPPSLTRREREMLVALCRPILGSSPFPQPATVRELAEHFVVSEAAVKFHLGSLYAKFDLTDVGDNRRLRLANEALRRRAVTAADLQRPAP